MYAEELEMNENFNPCPVFANTTGDVLDRESDLVQQNADNNQNTESMKDLYMVYADFEKHTRTIRRRGSMKKPIRKTRSPRQICLISVKTVAQFRKWMT